MASVWSQKMYLFWNLSERNLRIAFRTGKSLCTMASRTVLQLGAILMQPSASKNPLMYRHEVMALSAMFGSDFFSAFNFMAHCSLSVLLSGQCNAISSCSFFTRQCLCSSAAALRAAWPETRHWIVGCLVPVPELQAEMDPPNLYKKAMRSELLPICWETLSWKPGPCCLRTYTPIPIENTRQIDSIPRGKECVISNEFFCPYGQSHWDTSRIQTRELWPLLTRQVLH